MKKISVVLATYNESNNLKDCLTFIKEIADEIIVVDGGSTDKTIEIANEFNAKVILTNNPPIFHINKQKALDEASNEWILQLDADERVSEKLGKEILKIINMSPQEMEEYQQKIKNIKIFKKHQRLIEERDGVVGKQDGNFNAFFIPRLNYFLGKFLRYGGVYPDGVIRLIRKNKAYLPCKSVHEQFVVEGRVGWLKNDLLHMADPNFKRYLERNSRYIELITDELKRDRTGKNLFQFINFCILKPVSWFLLTQIRHKGILDGFAGVIFSFFSALRFPRAYIRYFKS